MGSVKQAIRHMHRRLSSKPAPASPSSSPSSSFYVLPPTAPPPAEDDDGSLSSFVFSSSTHALPQTPLVTLYPAYAAASPVVPEARRAKDTALLLKFQDSSTPLPTTASSSSISSPKSDPMFLAAYHGTIDRVHEYLEAGYNAHAAHNPYGESLLHLAAASPSPHVLKVIQALVEGGGLKVKATDYSRRTPLHVAAAATGPAGVNAPAVVKKLALYKADLNAQDDQGQTALHVAVAKGHPQVVRMLLYYDALPSLQDKKGRTPLMLAAAQGDVDLVRLLLAHGAEATGVQVENGAVSKEIEALVRAHAAGKQQGGTTEEKEEKALILERCLSPLSLMPEEEEKDKDDEEAKDPLRFTQELPPVQEEQEEEGN